MRDSIESYLDALKKTLDALDRDAIIDFFSTLARACREKRKIFIMGNGGSAATASHFVCDFNKGLSFGREVRYKFICLNDNVPTMMAYANDLSYDDVFVEQLSNLLEPGDVVIGLSGSGNSSNVVKAFEYANAHRAVTVALVGYNGGQLKQMARKCLYVPADDMQIAEDIHMVICHLGMRALEVNAPVGDAFDGADRPDLIRVS